MRTNHKKASYNTWKIDKLGQGPVPINRIRSIFKFGRALQNISVNPNELVGFARNEEVEALALEAESKRNQGRAYAGVMPIR